MNCQAGDVAIIVGPDGDPDVGRLVDVIEPAPSRSPRGPAWLVRTKGSPLHAIEVWFDDAGRITGWAPGLSHEVEVPDRHLRPIRPGTDPVDVGVPRELETM